MAEKSKPRPKSARGAAGSKPQPGGKTFVVTKHFIVKGGGKSFTVKGGSKGSVIVKAEKSKPARRPSAKAVAEIVDALVAVKAVTVSDDPPEFDAIPGVPSKAEIEALASELQKPDQTAFAELRTLLARHLGSHAAARVWLKSAVPGLEGTPLDAVKAGGVGRLLAVQKERWGESATYA